MTPFKIGVTGTRWGTTKPQIRALLHFLLYEEDEIREFHHGDCRGADIEAAAVAVSLGYRVVCHPPVSTSMRGFFDKNAETREPKWYGERDKNIVNETSVLVALPHTQYEIPRSGTWLTVRYARELGRPITIIFPDGKIKQENYKP